MKLRIGSVPYLNAKPLVEWFHSRECDADVDLVYAVPSRLAAMLRAGEIDVCNCSIFESLSAGGLTILPGVSISSDGPVRSVRLFCKRPVEEIETVALDTSSLSSSALTRIVLDELYSLHPDFRNLPPNLDTMLTECDAGLIIGDLKLFDLHPGTTVLDLGECWQRLAGLPFVYAAWQAPSAKVTPELANLLEHARDWGVERLDALADKWSRLLDLPIDRCHRYFTESMQYDLTAKHIEGLQMFQSKCVKHGLIQAAIPLSISSSRSTSSSVL